MSKFKVIDGGNDNVKDLDEVTKLLKDYDAIKHQLGNGGLLVYAYHFARSGATRQASKVMNEVDPNYFLADIYKDLFSAMLCWSVYSVSSKEREELLKEAEFYAVVRRSIAHFKMLKFKAKPQYVAFLKTFKTIVDFTVEKK